MSPAVLLGLALLAVYWAWIFVFFGRVRPRIMEALGRRLAVRVRESTDVLDAGTYDTRSDRAPLRKKGAIYAADLAVLLLGTVGVAALLFVPAFIVADRGALLPLEARITGRGATVEAAAPAEMARAKGDATLALRVTNDGREALASCAVAVDGYAARNGYLNGRSATFDLPANEQRQAVVPLHAMNPPPGEHRFRVKLECANERIAVADALLVVR